jgi:hypothetical protein
MLFLLALTGIIWEQHTKVIAITIEKNNKATEAKK